MLDNIVGLLGKKNAASGQQSMKAERLDNGTHRYYVIITDNGTHRHYIILI